VSVARIFSRYYGIPYPGDKLDLIAIPDFASGAMENLGAITFRETALFSGQAQSDTRGIGACCRRVSMRTPICGLAIW
jgi:aminopeptidase N